MGPDFEVVGKRVADGHLAHGGSRLFLIELVLDVLDELLGRQLVLLRLWTRRCVDYLVVGDFDLARFLVEAHAGLVERRANVNRVNSAEVA